jgi:hypothetical protein
MRASHARKQGLTIEDDKKSQHFKASEMIALFCHFYPQMWYSPSYPTKSGIIPWDFMVQLYRCIPMIEMRNRINMYESLLLANTSEKIEKNKRGPIDEIVKSWERQARPELHR